MTRNQPTKPAYLLAAVIGTIVLALAGIALITMELLDEARGRQIEDAPQTPLTIALVIAAGCVVAAGWAIWLIRDRGFGSILSKVVAAVAVVLLIATPYFGYTALNSERDLTVTTSTCTAESLRNSSSNLRNGCEEAAVDTIVLLEGVKSDDTWVPDEATGNLTRVFADLPAGNWKTKITVDGPEEAVTVVVVTERDGKQVKLGTLRPYADQESERLRWSGIIPVSESDTDLQVLFFLSENPAAESAKIRFNVHSCDGQSAANFDASRCQPMKTDSPLVFEETPEGTRTWRQLHVFREGDSFVVSNLEPRAYALQPDYVNIEKTTQSTDVAIIPAAMEQVPENSITVPGESGFEITIESNTGELIYNIYVFPTGPSYAQGS